MGGKELVERESLCIQEEMVILYKVEGNVMIRREEGTTSFPLSPEKV